MVHGLIAQTDLPSEHQQKHKTTDPIGGKKLNAVENEGTRWNIFQWIEQGWRRELNIEKLSCCRGFHGMQDGWGFALGTTSGPPEPSGVTLKWMPKGFFCTLQHILSLLSLYFLSFALSYILHHFTPLNSSGFMFFFLCLVKRILWVHCKVF